MFLSHALLALLVGQPTSAPAQPDIKCADTISTNQQQNGTAGCSIFMGSKSPQQEKLDSAMVLHSREVAEAVKKIREAPFYMYLVENNGENIDKDAAYLFFAGDDYDLGEAVPESAPTCEISEDAQVAGLVTTFSFNRHANFKHRWLAEDDRRLRQLCAALRQNVRSTASGKGVTAYDILSKGMNQGVFLQFNPAQLGGASFEKSGARLYWKAATSGFDADDLLRKAKTPSGYVGAEAIAADLEENGEAAGSFDLQNFGLAETDEPFSGAALSVFGPGLREMDSKWSAFLSNSEIVLNDRSRRVMAGSNFSPMVHRFRLATVTGPELVEHASSVSDFMEGLNCLGTVFAVNNNHATVAELPNYRRCAILATTRAQR